MARIQDASVRATVPHGVVSERCFLTVWVAAARSMVVFDTLRASTRTVLLDQAVASGAKNRLLVASEALATSPTRCVG